MYCHLFAACIVNDNVRFRVSHALLRGNENVCARNTEFHPETYRNLQRFALYLTSHLNFDNFTVVQVIELATMLGRRSEHVSRAVRKLEARGVIMQGGKIGRSKEWRLNPK
jgi:hypothetical protein